MELLKRKPTLNYIKVNQVVCPSPDSDTSINNLFHNLTFQKHNTKLGLNLFIFETKLIL